MTAEEALEIIVDLLDKVGSDACAPPASLQLLGDIETIARSYGEMDYEVERDLVDDGGWYQGSAWRQPKFSGNPDLDAGLS